jgi:predicted transglutaminase-like cysteine proteinase
MSNMKEKKFRFVVMFAAVSMTAMWCLPVLAAKVSYFNMTSKRSENLVPFPKWTGVVGRFEKEKKLPESECGQRKYHPCVIKEWLSMLDEVRDKSFRDQLDAINDWGNAHPYIIDQLNWGMEDYWETPYEFMEVNGDCEDYAIAKYYSLRAIGLPDDKMRIIIVQDLNLGGIIHAVLGVYDDDELLILDNQSKQVMPALKIYHYRPIYGVNEDWWWAYYPKV